jgi:hypothetical protein
MNIKKNLSTVQYFMLCLVISLLCADLASAAPLYGRFTLPYEVRWGHAVLPSGDYLLGFQEFGGRVFVLIRDAKSGKDIALLAPLGTSDAKGTSALLIADKGNHRIVDSLRLAKLGKVLIYAPAIARGPGDIRGAHKVQSLPVVATNKTMPE